MGQSDLGRFDEPARSFGPDLVGGNFSHYLAYVAIDRRGPAAGQGALFTETHVPATPKRKAHAKHHPVCSGREAAALPAQVTGRARPLSGSGLAAITRPS